MRGLLLPLVEDIYPSIRASRLLYWPLMSDGCNMIFSKIQGSGTGRCGVKRTCTWSWLMLLWEVNAKHLVV